MPGLKRLKRSILIRSIVIPLVVTLAVLFVSNAILPSLESRLPNGSTYSAQAEEDFGNE